MAAGHRHGVDGFLAEFVRDLLHLFDLEFAEVVGGADGVEKRGFTKFGHSDVPILHVGMNGPTGDGLRGKWRSGETQTPDGTTFEQAEAPICMSRSGPNWPM